MESREGVKKYVRNKHEKKLPANSLTIYNSKYVNPFKEKCPMPCVFVGRIKEEDRCLAEKLLTRQECLYLYEKYILSGFTEKDKDFLRKFDYLITYKQEKSEVDLLLQWLS